MHRIDGPSATNDNKFRSGNPQIGQEGTLVTPEWLNDIQENVARVILGAGIALVKGGYDQLTTAINTLINTAKTAAINTASGDATTKANAAQAAAIAAAATDASTKRDAAITAAAADATTKANAAQAAAVAAAATDATTKRDAAIAAAAADATAKDNVVKSVTINGGGLATGGGSLAANRTITVPAAGTAEARDWVNVTHALTPNGLWQAFGGAHQSLAASGLQDLPGGMSMRWGTVSENITSDGTFSFANFAAPFATACLVVIVCPYNPSSDANADSVPGVVSWTTAGVQCRSNTTSGVATTHGFTYLAIGF